MEVVGYFDGDKVEKLYEGREQVRQAYASLLQRYLARSYRSERGREFAYYGLCRRLGIMARAVEVIYEKLPPENQEIPVRDDVNDATIAIQSFVVNTFGCLDNLAWIWVCEKPVLNSARNELDRRQVGFAPHCEHVRRSLSTDFVSYVDSRQDWVDKLKPFRDSFAHRIPLYIPPFIVDPKDAHKYNALEKLSADALRQHDFERYDELQAAQKALGFWRPWMTHSFTERAPQVVFHAQVIADFLTIDEFGRELLKEFERQAV